VNEIHLNEKRRELYLPVLSSAVRNTLQNVERRLEQAVKRGEVRPIRTADLMFSIFSLNVMSFVGQSLVQQAFDLDREDMRQFILQRRAENIEMIFSRLRK
jgi:TetR/AcrR family transcriptional regulator